MYVVNTYIEVEFNVGYFQVSMVCVPSLVLNGPVKSHTVDTDFKIGLPLFKMTPIHLLGSFRRAQIVIAKILQAYNFL